MNKLKIEKRKSFHSYIQKKFAPKIIYYPACGGDSVPKDIYRNSCVIHLSLEGDSDNENYFSNLGVAVKLTGTMQSSPIYDNSVDLVIIKIHGLEIDTKTFDDIDRTLKTEGLVVIEDDGYNNSDRKKWQAKLEMFKNYKKIILPQEFSDNQEMFGVVKENSDYYDAEYLPNEDEMIEFVTNNPGYVGFNEILDYAVFQKKD